MIPALPWLAGGALRRYWRELTFTGLVAIIVLGGALWLRGDRAARRREGVLLERIRTDSVRTAVRERALDTAQRRTDTVIREVTLGITRWRTDTAWRRDTVFVAGDSIPRYAVPVATIHATDSTLRSCSVVIARCESERRYAMDLVAALKEENATLRAVRIGGATIPDTLRRASWKRQLLTHGLTAAAGYAAGRLWPPDRHGNRGDVP